MRGHREDSFWTVETGNLNDGIESLTEPLDVRAASTNDPPANVARHKKSRFEFLEGQSVCAFKLSNAKNVGYFDSVYYVRQKKSLLLYDKFIYWCENVYKPIIEYRVINIQCEPPLTESNLSRKRFVEIF